MATKKVAAKKVARKSVAAKAVALAPSLLNVTVFSNVQVPAGGNAIGPSGGLDLSGYRDYRLVLRIDGPPNASFTVNELYGPAGTVQQLNVDIGTGRLDQFGGSNYRKVFDVFGPKFFHIRVFNQGSTSMKVNGSIYAVK